MTQADSIADLLERERAALRRADFVELRALLDEKERLVADLDEAPIADPETLKRLRNLAERNEELLGAVKRGIDSAATRLKHMRNADEPLETYTRSGQRTQIGATQGSLTRRA